jgi:hypothetical protein
MEFEVRLRTLHPYQQLIKDAPFKRKIVRAGRRGGKTVLAADIACDTFMKGLRCLYASPTKEQIDAFWYEVCRAFRAPIDGGVLRKNETEHIIELPETKTRIRAKTAWNADMLRGDYADVLILDEFQLMNEETWDKVGAPMLMDNNGDAYFFYTPPSLHTRSVTKARDPRHASKLFQRARASSNGRWAAFHFTSTDNPYLSSAALSSITDDMSHLSYRQEILAEDVEEVAGALWKRDLLDRTRVTLVPQLFRVVVGVDPPGGATECGIVTCGIGMIDGVLHGYILNDVSAACSPEEWAGRSVGAYREFKADRIVAEANYGGDMVENTVRETARNLGEDVSFKMVHAARGKAVRAEPIVAIFEQGRCHLVGEHAFLEEELCTWVPGVSKDSPNRLDAMVWALTELMLDLEPEAQNVVYDAMQLVQLEY